MGAAWSCIYMQVWGAIVSGSVVSLEVLRPLLVLEPHAFPNIIRCNWFPHSSVVENAFGCQSACAQTALPPGPAFGAASAYEKCILDGGPSMYLYIYIHTHNYKIHTHIFIYTHTYIHTYTHIYIYIHTHIYIYTDICTDRYPEHYRSWPPAPPLRRQSVPRRMRRKSAEGASRWRCPARGIRCTMPVSVDFFLLGVHYKNYQSWNHGFAYWTQQTNLGSFIFPHIFVWGSCFWFSIPGLLLVLLLPPRLLHTTCHPQLCHTQLVTHNFVRHNLSHTTCHPQLCHTQLVVHNFLTHNLSPTTLSHTTCHTTTCHPQLCHTQLVTHNFVHTTCHTHTTCHPQLCHTHNSLSHTQLVTWQAWHLATATSPTTLSHTTCPPQLCHTQLVTHNLSPITLSHTQLFVTHNLSRGRRGTWRRPPSFCVAGVTLGNNLSPTTLPHTTCHTQLVTHNFVTHHLSRGRRGTWRHPPAFAGVALGDIYLRFTRQAWHLWHWAGSGGALGLGVVAGDAAALCVAGVALGDIYLRFTWRAWTWRHLPVFSVAGVALLALGWLWWRAWAGISRRWRRGTLRGRCGTWRHVPSFHVAGVALGDIYLCFPWQAWHLYGTGLALVARLGWD